MGSHCKKYETEEASQCEMSNYVTLHLFGRVVQQDIQS